jgi:hypothetical protein
MMMRARLAPSAVRTTISVSRVAARANMSSATLPQISTSRRTTGRFISESPAASSVERSTIDFA